MRAHNKTVIGCVLVSNVRPALVLPDTRGVVTVQVITLQLIEETEELRKRESR